MMDDGSRDPMSRKPVLELDRRGYILGIIANTITETEIPDWMESDGLTNYFKAVSAFIEGSHPQAQP